MLKSGAVERYARALFDLAVEEDQLDQFNQELTEIHGLLAGQADLKRLLHHPRIPEADKKDMMRRILEDASPMVVNFIMLLIDKGRVTILSDIIETFQDLAREAKGIIEVQVYSALELTASVEAKLADKLKKLTGKEVELKVAIDKSLIGGMKLRIGDKVIDGSIQTHLGRIKENLGQIQVSQLGVN